MQSNWVRKRILQILSIARNIKKNFAVVITDSTNNFLFCYTEEVGANEIV